MSYATVEKPQNFLANFNNKNTLINMNTVGRNISLPS